ncbi:MAG: Holliday junction branch migration protein RuvA [Gammaproteobacteria bacterium TMED78]|nr:MAG: Holliday junction branch migration protein RuvA [Gammaproteobacteria bacterium TMED78]|tara:strand:+ start:41087 stop:41662 length:576 start_codon:yes stop_codon:yes gene_type:complete
MINYLFGELVSKKPPLIVLNVNGVGYEIEVSMATFYNLPDVGSNYKIITHLLIRDDAHILYGFSTEEEKKLFRNLIKTSGVGSRIALAILSGISIEGFKSCVVEKNVTALTKIPGIGNKTAERLLVDMADKISDISLTTIIEGSGNNEVEAQSALEALGYRSPEIIKMLKSLDKSLSTEELIRQALKNQYG